MRNIILAISLFTMVAYAAATRYLNVTGLKSLDGTKTYALPAASSTLYGSASNTDWRVDANITGANCDLGTTAVTTYINVSDPGLTLTNRTGTNTIVAKIPCVGTTAPSGTTCSGVDEVMGVNFTIPAITGSGIDVEVCAEFELYIATGAGGSSAVAVEIVHTADNSVTTVAEGNSRLVCENGTASIAHGCAVRTCGTFTFATAGSKTFRLKYEMTAGGTVSSVLVIADANANVGQRDVHWTARPLN